ncbi:hypothetical protein AVEN_156237-1 [Araneus ventricosus]|uniref:Uncharacterized protein n=1 Tax=Araneus ventricosus TaxID=182803 RepID=A0A4Y2XA95_ARAVE|nr:hypothetical protein AVEN_156237-1 [Araneus ventricosus]
MKQETDDEKEKNLILMEEFKKEDFGCFQQETEAAKMVEVIYLKSSSRAEFSTNICALIVNVGGARMNVYYSCVCGIQGVGDDELDMTGLRTTNLAKSKFVSVVNDQFAISESQLKAVLPDSIFEEDCKKKIFAFQVM